jgi:hypothetical protein
VLAVSGCSNGSAEGTPAAASAGTPPARVGTQADPSTAIALVSSGAASAEPSPATPAVATGKTRDITFDTIKFPMTKEEAFERKMLTPQIEALKGQKIRIRGYILPTSRQHISQFVLVRDNKECCFGPGAALYDCVNVVMDEGESTQYSLWPVAVEGIFDVRILPGFEPNGRPLAIYHLQASKVK